MKLNEGPSAGYQDLVLKGQLIEDNFQLIAVNELERLHDILQGYELSDASGSWIKKLLFKSTDTLEKPQGLYVYGGVGRGKSMLMDLFFDGVAVRNKRSCLLYTSPSPRDGLLSRMPSSA